MYGTAAAAERVCFAVIAFHVAGLALPGAHQPGAIQAARPRSQSTCFGAGQAVVTDMSAAAALVHSDARQPKRRRVATSSTATQVAITLGADRTIASEKVHSAPVAELQTTREKCY
jgi:hypothetical protein